MKISNNSSGMVAPQNLLQQSNRVYFGSTSKLIGMKKKQLTSGQTLIIIEEKMQLFKCTPPMTGMAISAGLLPLTKVLNTKSAPEVEQFSKTLEKISFNIESLKLNLPNIEEKELNTLINICREERLPLAEAQQKVCKLYEMDKNEVKALEGKVYHLCPTTLDERLGEIKEKYQLEDEDLKKIKEYIEQKTALSFIAKNREKIQSKIHSHINLNSKNFVAISRLCQAIDESEEISMTNLEKNLSPEFLKEIISSNLSKNEYKEILATNNTQKPEEKLQEIIVRNLKITNLKALPRKINPERKVIVSKVLADNKIDYSQLSTNEQDFFNFILMTKYMGGTNTDRYSQLTQKAIDAFRLMQANNAFGESYTENKKMFGTSAILLLKNKFSTPEVVATLLSPCEKVKSAGYVKLSPFTVIDGRPSEYVLEFEKFKKEWYAKNPTDSELPGIGSYADMMCHVCKSFGDSNYQPDTHIGVHHNPNTKEIKSTYIASSYDAHEKSVKYIDQNGDIQILYLGRMNLDKRLSALNKNRTFIVGDNIPVWTTYVTRRVDTADNFNTSKGSGVEILSGIKELERYNGLVEIKPKGASVDRLIGRVNNKGHLEILFYAPKGIHKNTPFEIYPLVNE